MKTRVIICENCGDEFEVSRDSLAEHCELHAEENYKLCPMCDMEKREQDEMVSYET
jgi:predicted amidophosphoribosyltransferase